ILIYGIEVLSNRALAGAVARRDRRAAMGWLGATGLARAWIAALAVLIVGLAAGKDAGLSAAVLAALLFTVHLGSRVLLRFTGLRLVFVACANIIGYLPLPTNDAETVHLFGLRFPSFAIYAATANISFALALTLVVWFSYHIEGIRAKGLFGYFKSFLPAGLEDMNPFGKAAIYVIELLSQFMRLVSLSVRLFANILAGHLLLLFMGGGLAVLLGLSALGALTFPLAFVFFVLEVGLIATLQAFIFATLSAIYIGGAVAETH